MTNVKIANLGGFRTLLPFFRTSLGVGFLNSAIFNSFHNPVEFGAILEGLWNFGGGLNTPKPPRYATDCLRYFAFNLVMMCLTYVYVPYEMWQGGKFRKNSHTRAVRMLLLAQLCLSVCPCGQLSTEHDTNVRTNVSVYVKADVTRRTALVSTLPRTQIAKIYQKENCTQQIFVPSTLFRKACCSRDS